MTNSEYSGRIINLPIAQFLKIIYKSGWSCLNSIIESVCYWSVSQSLKRSLFFQWAFKLSDHLGDDRMPDDFSGSGRGKGNRKYWVTPTAQSYTLASNLIVPVFILSNWLFLASTVNHNFH